MKDLNYDAVISFGVFAEKLNFTHAAEELHISQPALHMKIQDLSSSLKMPLYRKVGRRLELTEAGKLLARFARELSSRTSSFLNELEGGEDDEPVILAAGEGAYLYLLGEGIRQFLKKPSCRLKLLTMNREGIIDAIQSGKAHLGVASLETVPAGFESKILARVEQVLVMPKKHPLSEKDHVRLKDLAGAKLIVPPEDRPHRQMLASALQSANVSWVPAVEANGWELMMHFVRLGLGLAVVNSNCVPPAGLIAKPLLELPRIHYHIFHLRGAAKQLKQSQLKQLLLESV